MKCRHCGSALHLPFLDLGSAPPSNAYLSEPALRAPELWFPLRLLVCQTCWLVQTEDHAHADELFSDGVQRADRKDHQHARRVEAETQPAARRGVRGAGLRRADGGARARARASRPRRTRSSSCSSKMP